VAGERRGVAWSGYRRVASRLDAQAARTVETSSPPQASSGGSASAERNRAWASWSDGRLPDPSHHGQVTSLRSPPSIETTFPVPRQGRQVSGSPSFVLEAGGLGLTSARG